MSKDDMMIKREVYTSQLNEMYAILSEYMMENMESRIYKELEEQRKIVAIAHRDSRFFSDSEHFAQWDKVLSDSRNLIRKAEECDVYG